MIIMCQNQQIYGTVKHFNPKKSQEIPSWVLKNPHDEKLGRAKSPSRSIRITDVENMSQIIAAACGEVRVVKRHLFRKQKTWENQQ